MQLEDAWRPVDECAGTAVDTFIYGVARGDGLFYPTKVCSRFGEDLEDFEQAAYYRVWNNMQSLIDRGLDPLTVLIDRAHDKGMDFFASLRLGLYQKMDPAHSTANGGRGFVHQEVRDHSFAVLEELATQYETDGVELDLAAAPAGSAYLLRDEDVEEYTPVITQWVGEVAEMVRSRPGGAGPVGVRVYPTEEINLSRGQDVRAWLEQGLVDFVVPMVYAHNLCDSNMPIEWLVEAAHAADVSVYPMINPYYQKESRKFKNRDWATPEMLRAAVANYWGKGVDGMYTFFFKWPLDDAGRRALTEMGDAELVREGDKHYLVNLASDYADELGYKAPLPLEIAAADVGTVHAIPLYVADDVERAAQRISEIRLKVNIRDLTVADCLAFRLNGASLDNETCRRSFSCEMNAYDGLWLEFRLEGVRPRQGDNVLEIELLGRADRLMSTLVVQDIELVVEYSPYPSLLGSQ